MRISNVSREDLYRAMDEVNVLYDGNVMFKSIKQANAKGTIWNVSLRAVKSDGPGARRAVSGRKLISACWHVFGDFMDLLPKNAVIRSGYFGESCRKPGEPWQEQKVHAGGFYGDVDMADLCDC